MTRCGRQWAQRSDGAIQIGGCLEGSSRSRSHCVDGRWSNDDLHTRGTRRRPGSALRPRHGGIGETCRRCVGARGGHFRGEAYRVQSSLSPRAANLLCRRHRRFERDRFQLQLHQRYRAHSRRPRSVQRIMGIIAPIQPAAPAVRQRLHPPLVLIGHRGLALPWYESDCSR